METEKGEWGFKALKQIVKLHQARQAHRNDELVSSTVDLHQSASPETTVKRC